MTPCRCWFPCCFSVTLHRCCFPWHIPWRPRFPRQLFPWHTLLTVCDISCINPVFIASSSILLSQAIRIYCSWSETNKQTGSGLSYHVITSHRKSKNVHSCRHTYHNAFNDAIQWHRTSRGFRDTFSVTLNRCWFPWRIPWRPRCRGKLTWNPTSLYLATSVVDYVHVKPKWSEVSRV